VRQPRTFRVTRTATKCGLRPSLWGPLLGSIRIAAEHEKVEGQKSGHGHGEEGSTLVTAHFARVSSFSLPAWTFCR
jgi:hypothetical protein